MVCKVRWGLGSEWRGAYPPTLLSVDEYPTYISGFQTNVIDPSTLEREKVARVRGQAKGNDFLFLAKQPKPHEMVAFMPM